MSALFVLAAYLVGSVSPGYLLFGVLRGGDIRQIGSGNPGATNMLRSAGLRPALVVLLADVAKGALPVIAARWAGLGDRVVAAVAFAAVAGHVFSLFLRFRGGKGVATAAGVFGALDLGAMALAGVVFLAVVATTRYVSAGSVTAAIAFPLIVMGWSRFRGVEAPSGAFLAAVLGIALLIVFKHRSNLRDLARGCERKLGENVTEGRNS